MALLTNGAREPQRRKIDAHQLAPFFDCILIEGEFGVGKPERQVYTHALKTLGVGPKDAWMVGDNFEWEVVAPKTLGIFSIWVDHLEKGVPDGAPVRPDRVIRAISELV